jgi:hypothetical protein
MGSKKIWFPVSHTVKLDFPWFPESKCFFNQPTYKKDKQIKTGSMIGTVKTCCSSSTDGKEYISSSQMYFLLHACLTHVNGVDRGLKGWGGAPGKSLRLINGVKLSSPYCLINLATQNALSELQYYISRPPPFLVAALLPKSAACLAMNYCVSELNYVWYMRRVNEMGKGVSRVFVCVWGV